MTEAEWRTADDPIAMLQFLRGNASDRKLRLFVCAGCRHIWRLLPGAARIAVEIAERFADGAVAEADRSSAFATLMTASGAQPMEEPSTFSIDWPSPAMSAAAIAIKSTSEGFYDRITGRCVDGAWHGGDAVYAAVGACSQFVQTVWIDANERRRSRQGFLDSTWRTVRKAVNELFSTAAHDRIAQSERNELARIVRDIFGNPFHPVAFDPTWRTATATSLAEAIYTERAFDRLPILADALEDAGCTSADVLEHCRQPGEHVRGCWVVDLVLGKS